MTTKQPNPGSAPAVTREGLVDLLNEDLAREYQAIISYVVYSQVIKGAQYMNIAAELAVHAAEELQHAITIASQIDYLGGMPKVAPKPVNVLVSAPFTTVEQLASLGVRRISVGGALARSAWGGFLRAAREIADHGTFSSFADAVPSPEMNGLFPV